MIPTETVTPEQKTKAFDDVKRVEPRGTWIWAGWEPDRYYTRLGANSTNYFGNGDWIQPWRERLESDDTLRKLADSGATLLITQFYKGMGLELERLIWPRLAEFVERAGRYNLDVLGYVQGHSLFGEFLFPERPEARDWVSRDRRGEPQTWGAAYQRFAPCLTSEGYRDYMKAIISEGLEGVGLAGIHLDNSYSKHCYCQRCRTLFREWLDRRGDLQERTGIPFARAVEPPPLSSARTAIHDPLVRYWIEFGVTRRMEFLAALQRHISDTATEAVFSANAAYLKSFASRLTHGLDPSLEGRVCNLVTIENGNQPRFENGELFTQAEKLLFAEAGGSRTMISSWRPGIHGHSPPKGERGIWALLSEEYSFVNCLPGNNWMLRPAGDGAAMLGDFLTVEMEAFCEGKKFFEKLGNELNLGDRRHFAEICLYADPDSLALNPAGQAMALQTFLGYALGNRVPLRIVFAEQDIPPETKIILLCDQGWIGDAELDRLKAFADGPGRKIWLLGPAALHDEWGVARSASLRVAFERHRGVERLPVSPAKWADVQGSPDQYFQGTPLRWKKDAEPELAGLVKKLATEQSVEIHGEPGLLLNLEIHRSGRLLIHLRDLSMERVRIDGVRLRIDPAVWSRTGVLGYSPAWFGREFSLPEDGELSIPDFPHYALLILEPACPPAGISSPQVIDYSLEPQSWQ